MQKSPTCAVFGAQQNVGRCLGRLGRFGDCAWEAQSQKTLQGPLANLANALGAWELSGKAGQTLKIEKMGWDVGGEEAPKSLNPTSRANGPGLGVTLCYRKCGLGTAIP